MVSIKPVDPPAIPEVPAGRRMIGGWQEAARALPPPPKVPALMPPKVRYILRFHT